MWTLCAIRVNFLWNLCEIFERRGGAAVGRTRSAKLSHEEPERSSVELVRQTERRLCRTTKRSGRGSNSFDKTVERWSAAAVNRTRSTRLSSDELPRFQRGCYSLLWICHQERIYFFILRKYVFANKSNQHLLTQYEGMHHNPFESFLSSGIALHFADPHIILSVGILSWPSYCFRCCHFRSIPMSSSSNLIFWKSVFPGWTT